MGKLSNKIALITGGNSGIGLAAARLFREEGARVIITARSKETFKKAKEELGGLFDVVQVDVSTPSDLDKLYAYVKENYGTFDILLANAGIASWMATEEVNEKFFDDHFDTNVKGLFFTVSKAIPLLNPGSSVVLTASAVSIKGFPNNSVYSATKAAVRSFARTWTAEIPVDLVRFNVLSPGLIETPLQGKMGMTGDMVKEIETMIPIKRQGQVEEIARAALFLASADSSYIVGNDLFADGGFSQI